MTNVMAGGGGLAPGPARLGGPGVTGPLFQAA